MNYTIKNANDYINSKINKVDNKYRLKFHMMPPIGWMNDPNGCVKFNDKYHVFYQFHPYDAKWGPMHWGHFSSKDLIKYENEEVALAPDVELESGCWSGGAISCDNQLALLYTRHYEIDGYKSQKQCIAKSFDGKYFKKEIESVFNNDELPENIVKNDFRDPFPVYKDGIYYLLVGGKLTTNEGIIIVLKGNSLNEFKYHFHIGPIYELGDMGECPAYFNVDGMDVIIASGCHVKQRDNNYKNENSSFYIAGHFDFENKKFNIKRIDELDKGDCFYAPQFINNNDKPVMIGWMEMWGKQYPTYELGHNWNGALTIPRILNWKNNTLYQRPIDEISNYYSKTYNYNGQNVSRISDIFIEAEEKFKIEFQSSNGKFVIGQNEFGVYLNTFGSNSLNDCNRHTNSYYHKCNIRVLLDTSSIEIFINDGCETITSRIYLDSDYKLNTEGLIHKILINEIVVE